MFRKLDVAWIAGVGSEGTDGEYGVESVDGAVVEVDAGFLPLSASAGGSSTWQLAWREGVPHQLRLAVSSHDGAGFVNPQPARLSPVLRGAFAGLLADNSFGRLHPTATAAARAGDVRRGSARDDRRACGRG